MSKTVTIELTDDEIIDLVGFLASAAIEATEKAENSPDNRYFEIRRQETAALGGKVRFACKGKGL